MSDRDRSVWTCHIDVLDERRERSHSQLQLLDESDFTGETPTLFELEPFGWTELEDFHNPPRVVEMTVPWYADPECPWAWGVSETEDHDEANR